MDDTQRRALGKVRKCLDLAADTRGDPTTRETAWRQAQALIAKHGLQLEQHASAASSPPAQPAMPHPLSAEWAPYWALRTSAEALQAGVRVRTLCSDGWLIAG